VPLFCPAPHTLFQLDFGALVFDVPYCISLVHSPDLILFTSSLSTLPHLSLLHSILPDRLQCSSIPRGSKEALSLTALSRGGGGGEGEGSRGGGGEGSRGGGGGGDGSTHQMFALMTQLGVYHGPLSVYDM
jgi:uncharacterized membrane protein YgcG